MTSRRIGWLVGVVLAAGINGVVFFGLRPAPVVVAPPPPLSTRVLSVVTPPEPPPPGAPGAVAGVLGAPATATAPLPALPAFDLPATEAPALPVGSEATLSNLPALVAPALDLPQVVAPVVPNEPPVLQSGFDLDRFYPYLARSRGLTGTSRLRLDLDEAGAVVTAQVLSSTPSGVFDEAALALARTLRFQPARHAGLPVATTTSLIIAWTIK